MVRKREKRGVKFRTLAVLIRRPTERSFGGAIDAARNSRVFHYPRRINPVRIRRFR